MIERFGGHVRVRPIRPPDALVRPPGSKSLTNRYLLCAALADGVSELRGASLAEDARVMVRGLCALGVGVEVDESTARMLVSGCRGHLPATQAAIDAGDAGTAMRFLTALCCLGYGRYTLDGSPRMRERPIGALVAGLMELGAGIGYDGASGFPPLTVVARGLGGGRVHFSRPNSSQFISAMLMVAPYARSDVMIRVDGGVNSRPYVDMTIDVMRSLGVEVLSDGAGRFIVPAAQRYAGRSLEIEPDASAATYFWAAAAMTGGRVRVAGLTRASRQGDVRFLDVLAQMGCTVQEGPDWLGVRGPTGRLRGVTVDLNDMPDVVQTLAVTALRAEGPTEIRNVANLRIKETDRLRALQAELSRLGAQVTLYEDGLRIAPPAALRGAEIETYNDHRMAMSFALAGLCTEGVVIRDADCVRKSFPGYFDALAKLAGQSACS